MLGLVLFVLLAAPVSEHITDACNGGKCTRRIQNDQNYRDAVGDLHVSEDDHTTGPFVTSTGRNFQYRKRSRLTFYAGDLDAGAAGKTRVFIQVTNKPTIWMAIRLLGAQDVPWAVHDSRTLKWVGAMPNCTLYFRAGRKGIQKVLACTASPGVGYIEMEYVLPVAAVVSAVARGWTIEGGGAKYLVEKGVVWDSANGSAFGLSDDGVPITTVTTLESNTVEGLTRTLVFRVNPTNSKVATSFAAGETVYMDPSVEVLP